MQSQIVKLGVAWIVSFGLLTFAAETWSSFALPAAYLALLGAAAVTIAWGAFLAVNRRGWLLVGCIVPGAVVLP
jgi:hypothetical protein